MTSLRFKATTPPEKASRKEKKPTTHRPQRSSDHFQSTLKPVILSLVAEVLFQ